MNWLFIVTLLFLVLSTVMGYRKGFVKIAYSLLSSLVALVLVGLLAPHVQTILIEKTPLYEKVVDVCTTQIQANIDQAVEDAGGNAEIVLEDDLPMSDLMLKLINKIDVKGESEWPAVRQAGAKVAKWIVLMVSFVATYLVVSVLLKVLGKVLNIAAKLPLVKGANKWLGLAVGLVQGFIDIWFAGLVLASTCTTATGGYLVSLIYENIFLKFLYEHNGIAYLISVFMG